MPAGLQRRVLTPRSLYPDGSGSKRLDKDGKESEGKGGKDLRREGVGSLGAGKAKRVSGRHHDSQTESVTTRHRKVGVKEQWGKKKVMERKLSDKKNEGYLLPPESAGAGRFRGLRKFEGGVCL